MAQSELLQIRSAEASQSRDPGKHWYEAVKVTAGGEQIVAESQRVEYPGSVAGKGWVEGLVEMFVKSFTSVFADDSGDWEEYRRALAENRNKLVGQLLADGWEPMATNDSGEVVTMQRKKL